jgi:malate dehydrogenase
MEGVKAELIDCAYPSLVKVVATCSLSELFKDSDYNFLTRNY